MLKSFTKKPSLFERHFPVGFYEGISLRYCIKPELLDKKIAFCFLTVAISHEIVHKSNVISLMDKWSENTHTKITPLHSSSQPLHSHFNFLPLLPP